MNMINLMKILKNDIKDIKDKTLDQNSIKKIGFPLSRQV